LPQETLDPMVAAAHLLLAAQSIVSRETSPLDSVVISFATMQAGSALNQIPDQAVLAGTARSLRAEVRDATEAAMHRIAAGVGATFGVDISLTIRRGVAVTANRPEEAAAAAAAATAAGLKLRRDLPPAMTGEDFGWYLHEIPGAFVWIGNGDTPGLHNAGYDYNDAILPAAAGFLAATARRALEGG
jgi:hippurate hydrolase